VGRERDVALVGERLADPGCRLLTILGPGGMGKTRLAVEVARRAQARGSSVVFVPLAAIPEVDQVVYVIAESMGVQLDPRADPVTQVLTHLAGDGVLLVLDNLEDLVPTNLVERILAAGDHVTVLATSREALNLRAEWVYELRGLGLSAETESEGENDAVELFVRCAQRASAGFALHHANEETVRHICRLVGGMPLALELAAGWSELLSAEDIASEIERGFELLETDLRDVPERQRSMRAMFETAWARLEPDERDAFERLAVFRGGFTRSAADRVAGAGPQVLRRLHGKSMVGTAHDNRYVTHELLRQHGEQRLLESGHASDARRLHCDFFLGWLAESTAALKGSSQLEAMRELSADIENIRAAWNDALANGRVGLLLATVEPIWLFFDTRGNVGEMSLLFREAESDTENGRYTGLLRACHGMVRVQQGGLEEGRALIEQGLRELADSPAAYRSSANLALTHFWLGWASFLLADNDAADEMARRGLALYEAAKDPWGIARCQYLMGNNDTALGRLQSAERVLEACRSTAAAAGDRRTLSLASRNLSILAGWFGDYEMARSLIEEALALSETFGDRLGTAYGMRELGKLHVVEGRPSVAVEVLDASIAITDEIGAQWESAATADDLGNALAALGDHLGAERAFTTCLTAAEASSNRYYVARCTGDLGALAFDRGDLERAEALLTAAGSRWREIGHEPYLAWALTQLGHVVGADSSRRRRAESLYTEALRLAIRHRLSPFALDLIAAMATLDDRRRDNRDALLQLAAHHPAASSATRQRALARIEGGVPEPLAHDLWGVAVALSEA
jgi:predicted ATPase